MFCIDRHSLSSSLNFWSSFFLSEKEIEKIPKKIFIANGGL
jgi:hypothetical protein